MLVGSAPVRGRLSGSPGTRPQGACAGPPMHCQKGPQAVRGSNHAHLETTHTPKPAWKAHCRGVRTVRTSFLGGFYVIVFSRVVYEKLGEGWPLHHAHRAHAHRPIGTGILRTGHHAPCVVCTVHRGKKGVRGGPDRGSTGGILQFQIYLQAPPLPSSCLLGTWSQVGNFAWPSDLINVAAKPPRS